MFQQSFRFNGRITRLEYALSILISYILAWICGFIFWFWATLMGFDVDLVPDDAYYIVVIPAYWFWLSQAIKRCHDIWKSWWYVLIPFFGLWLLFEDSQKWSNIYGVNPKWVPAISTDNQTIDQTVLTDNPEQSKI